MKHRENVRQLRQVLMFWPINLDKPKMKLSVASDPTKSFSRQPDQVIEIRLSNTDLIVYYFGADRSKDEIVTHAFYGK